MKKWNLLYTFLFFLPILDVLSSITTRFYPNIISLGIIIKGVAILISIIYLLFVNKSKYKKLTSYYLLTIFIFILVYFITKIDLLNYGYFVSECKYLFKYIYFPVMFVTLLNVFSEYGLQKELINDIFIANLLMYLGLIIIPSIFNIGFDSYIGGNLGSVGFFYSANEISAILLLLFPFTYLFLNKNSTMYLIVSILSLICLNMVGTKVSLFGTIILSFLAFSCILFKEKKLNNKNVILSLCILIISISFLFNGYAMHNLKGNINDKFDNKQSETIYDTLIEEVELEEQEKIEEPNKFKETFDKMMLIVFSERNIYLKNTNYLYKKDFNINTLLAGIGFSNTERIRDYHIEKTIEIDILDMFYHLGLLAVLIFILPFILIMYKLFKNKLFNIEIFYLLMVIGLTLGISSFAGHVYMAPAVSIYVVLYMMMLSNEINMFKKSEINNKKITFLNLHLGYGGVENATINTANMLASKYDVEIISLYKKESIPYNVDKNIKIKYLMNTCSNREEFKKSLKDKNIIKIFKEGFKAIYILFNKKLLIRNEILNSDAKIIISTRFEFSKLLDTYGRINTIKIHEEHTYNVNNKYMNKINNLDNIDYIRVVSKELYKNYKKNINKQIIYIPLALNNYPKEEELNYTKNKNIIAVGRLEKEKGFIDLIEVLNIVVKKDKNVYLNIFGDGSEKEKIVELINKYNLNNNVCLHGFKEQKEIFEYLKNSSLYVMTSREESFGLVLIEAMSYGVPCIAFDSAKGAKDVINGKNGFFVKNRNINKMANMIVEYLNYNKKVQKEYRTNARITTEKYTKEDVSKEWINFIDNILEK